MSASREPNSEWLHTMEASIGTPEAPRVMASREGAGASHSIEWLGWVFAAGFFFLLLRMQIRQRRKDGLLLKRDQSTLLFPPIGNRRRRPR